MLDEALGLLDHHLGDLYVARGRLVEGGGHDLALHRPLHVGHFLRALVDQEHDQIALRMIGRDGMGDVLEDDRLTGARLRDDQTALALADRGNDVDDPARVILLGRVLGLHLEPFVRVERRQVVEVDLVTLLVGVLEIDRIDLEKREIPLAFLGAPDLPFDRISGPEAEAPDLRRGDIDVVRSGEVVRIGRPQETEAVLQDLDHALAGDVHVAAGELLENREHQLLLAHGVRVFDFDFFREAQELRGRFSFQILQLHFLHPLLTPLGGKMLWFRFPRAHGARSKRRGRDVRRRDGGDPPLPVCVKTGTGPRILDWF